MYTAQIFAYLTWPVFILVSWLIVRSAVTLYEKRNSVPATGDAEGK
jgi:hypothetical protein